MSPQPNAEGGEFFRSQVAGRGSSCNKVRPDHPLNGLLANDDSGLIKGELTGRKSKPFKGDRTDVKLVKVQQVKISLTLNTCKHEQHLRCLLNDDTNSYPLICVFLWPQGGSQSPAGCETPRGLLVVLGFSRSLRLQAL